MRNGVLQVDCTIFEAAAPDKPPRFRPDLLPLLAVNAASRRGRSFLLNPRGKRGLLLASPKECRLRFNAPAKPANMLTSSFTFPSLKVSILTPQSLLCFPLSY